MKETTFVWVWSNNGWRLAVPVRPLGSGAPKYQLVKIDISDGEVWESGIILGPPAGKISATPAIKPSFPVGIVPA